MTEEIKISINRNVLLEVYSWLGFLLEFNKRWINNELVLTININVLDTLLNMLGKELKEEIEKEIKRCGGK
jgi:hypothetical protein